MLDVLKKFAAQKIQEQFASNSLNESDTAAAGEDGANALLSGLMDQIGGGKLDQIKNLLSGQEGAQNSDLVSGLTSKLQEQLQARGLGLQEAQENAQNAAPELLNSLKDKFLSSSSEDSDFDISKLSELAGGAGGILNIAKGFLGK